jgi:hypothetical protein
VKVIESERISTLIWDKSNYTAFIPEAGSDFNFNFYAFVRLTVYIEEFNDHPPMFYSADGRYPRTEVRIPETTAVGSLIAQVSSRMKMIA